MPGYLENIPTFRMPVMFGDLDMSARQEKSLYEEPKTTQTKEKDEELKGMYAQKGELAQEKYTMEMEDKQVKNALWSIFNESNNYKQFITDPRTKPLLDYKKKLVAQKYAYMVKKGTVEDYGEMWKENTKKIGDNYRTGDYVQIKPGLFLNRETGKGESFDMSNLGKYITYNEYNETIQNKLRFDRAGNPIYPEFMDARKLTGEGGVDLFEGLLDKYSQQAKEITLTESAPDMGDKDLTALGIYKDFTRTTITNADQLKQLSGTFAQSIQGDVREAAWNEYTKMLSSGEVMVNKDKKPLDFDEYLAVRIGNNVGRKLIHYTTEKIDIKAIPNWKDSQDAQKPQGLNYAAVSVFNKELYDPTVNPNAKTEEKYIADMSTFGETTEMAEKSKVVLDDQHPIDYRRHPVPIIQRTDNQIAPYIEKNLNINPTDLANGNVSADKLIGSNYVLTTGKTLMPIKLTKNAKIVKITGDLVYAPQLMQNNPPQLSDKQKAKVSDLSQRQIDYANTPGQFPNFDIIGESRGIGTPQGGNIAPSRRANYGAYIKVTIVDDEELVERYTVANSPYMARGFIMADEVGRKKYSDVINKIFGESYTKSKEKGQDKRSLGNHVKFDVLVPIGDEMFYDNTNAGSKYNEYILNLKNTMKNTFDQLQDRIIRNNSNLGDNLNQSINSKTGQK